MAVIKQELIRENDGKGTVRLKNTIDCSGAAEMAKLVNANNAGGYFGEENGKCRVMGFIPPEMWQFDPWLITARKAQREGDLGKFQHYLKKFFEVYPAFQVHQKSRMWRGHRAVLL